MTYKAPARIYCELEHFREDGTPYGVLRVTAHTDHGTVPSFQIRLWAPLSTRPDVLVPTRTGITVKASELDAITYACALAREDLQSGKLKMQLDHRIDPTFELRAYERRQLQQQR